MIQIDYKKLRDKNVHEKKTFILHSAAENGFKNLYGPGKKGEYTPLKYR